MQLMNICLLRLQLLLELTAAVQPLPTEGKLMTELPLSSSLFVISEPATAKSRVNEQMGIKISPQRHPKH